MMKNIDKRFKKSRFNILVSEGIHDECVVLFNTLTTSLVSMDKNCVEIYENIGSIDIKHECDDNKETIKNMYEQGFIVSDDVDELALYNIHSNKSRFGSDTLSITIGTTLDCNMKCPYCYEKSEDAYIDENTADDIIGFIESYMKKKNIKHLNITWYGGEPLLNVPIIEYITNKIIPITEELNVMYSSFIVTNGTLLDKDMAQKLVDLHIPSAQITLDGMKQTNDARRLLKNGTSSFDIITNNIQECKNIMHITVRCNIDKNNSNECNDLQDFFLENKIAFYFAPVDSMTESNEDYNDCFTQAEYSNVDLNLFKRWLPKSDDPLIDLFPTQRFCYCGALQENNFVIDPYGNLYKCWSEIGDDQRVVGTVKDGPQFNSHNIKWLTLDIDEKCSKCEKLPICSGGCPLNKINGVNRRECSHSSLNIAEKIGMLSSHMV